MLKQKAIRKKFIYYLAAVLVTMILMSLSGILVSAAAVDVSPLTTAVTDFGTTLQSFGAPLLLVVLIIGGICFMGGQQGRALGKVIVLGGVIGFAVIAFATNIVSSLQSILSASGGAA